MSEPQQIQSAKQAINLTPNQLYKAFILAQKSITRNQNPQTNAVRISLIMNELFRKKAFNRQNGD